MYTAAIVYFWVFANIYSKKKFKESTGKKIIPVLFSYWGTFKYCNAPIYTCGDIDKLIKSLRLYRSYNSTAIDDCIEGEYNGLNLKIVELDLQDKAEDSAEQIFDGLMMEVDIYKNFTSHTIIKPDKAFRETRELKRVILEDPEFEKEFDVYSNDQVDSRYILTTAFMRRLVELKMSVKKRVEVVFYNQKAYFFIDYREDKFELPINKPVTDMQHYQNILLDLVRILRVVDTLKLEQNIGL